MIILFIADIHGITTNLGIINTINFDKLVNQLTPHYLGGRKYVLWLQSLCHPLKSLNDAFKEWAVEKRIEASMTSQTIMLEWFLNHKFNKYFIWIVFNYTT